MANDGYEGVTVAGLAIVRRDGGTSAFLTQRTFDESDDVDVRETWEFPGGHLNPGEEPFAAAAREFEEEVGFPLPEGEVVDGWRNEDGTYQGFVYEVEGFPSIQDWTATDEVQAVGWFSLDDMDGLGPALRPEVRDMDWSVLSEEDDMAENEAPEFETASDEILPVPWFGILTVEGTPSGDKRQFREGSLRTRPLPVPLTWQKVGASGHDGHVTIGTIEKVWRNGGNVWGSGFMLQTPEADEATALIAAFGRYGVSIDADDLDEFSIEVHDDGLMEFTDARHCSACMVSIPAFAQAQIMLGTYSDEYAGGWGAPSQEIPTLEDDAEDAEGECVEWDDEGNCVQRATPDEEAAAFMASLVAAAKTEDGPGWLTHPVDTDRLRDYWVRGEGAAKIAWGTPGDFNRCRVNLAKYVKPQYLAGYCANRHYDALGFWPGEHHAGEAINMSEPTIELQEVVVDETASLVAAAPKVKPKHSWFADPGFSGPTAIRVEDGRFFGHLATWGTCHIGYGVTCTDVPHSATGYAYFMTGMIETDEGFAYVGNISMGGGHAEDGLGWRPAADHYDSTSTVVADVSAGEDEFGIWVSGALREGVTEAQVAELLASGGLSGDWREVRRGSGELELVAALAVNVGGFPVPRIGLAASGGRQTSLVAAGVITNSDDPIDDIADAVVARLDERRERQEAAQRLAAMEQAEVEARLSALRD
jgi:8-oxo-dGTP pyrophosphatase MutT (NUDIX family)